MTELCHRITDTTIAIDAVAEDAHRQRATPTRRRSMTLAWSPTRERERVVATHDWMRAHAESLRGILA
jgi:hypothetical protein